MFKSSFMIESIKQQILVELEKDVVFRAKFKKALGIGEETPKDEE